MLENQDRVTQRKSFGRRSFRIALPTIAIAGGLTGGGCQQIPPIEVPTWFELGQDRSEPKDSFGRDATILEMSDADGFMVVDLRTARNQNPGKLVGVGPIIRFDPVRGETHFDDGTVRELDGTLLNSPQPQSPYYGQMLSSPNQVIYAALDDETRQRLRDRKFEVGRENRAAYQAKERERRNVEARAAREQEQRERATYEESIAHLVEQGYELNSPIRIRGLNASDGFEQIAQATPKESAEVAETQEKASQPRRDRRGRPARANVRPTQTGASAPTDAVITRRLDPANALANASWLYIPLDRIDETNEVVQGDRDAASIANADTLVLTFDSSGSRFTVTSPEMTERLRYSREGGFKKSMMGLSVEEAGYIKMWLWDDLPNPFGVSSLPDGRLLLTTGYRSPRVAGVLLGQGDGADLVEAQTSVSSSWRASIEQMHAQGRAVETLVLPDWGEGRLAIDRDMPMGKVERLLQAIYDRSSDLPEAIEPMTGMLQAERQVISNYFTAFELAWHEANPNPTVPVNYYEFTQDGYRLINNWGTVTEKRDAIAELVRIRTKYAEEGEPAYQRSMRAGSFIDQRLTTQGITKIAEYFYSIYPPGSPTAERMEASLYHYLKNGI